MSSGGAWHRRIAGRLLATSVAKRALASIRWRAGLDAELNDLRFQVANLERTIESVVAHVSAPLPTRGSIKAFATPSDADLLESLFLRMSTRFGNTLRVLEWGSGLSTLHYPDWLRSRGVRVDWTALEHDRGLFRHALEPALRARGAEIIWAEDVLVQSGAEHAEGVRVIVFDTGSIDPSDAGPSKPLDHYVGMPAALGYRFHVIIVDGRQRTRCLAEAAMLLEDGGSCCCTTRNESATARECPTSGRVDASETNCGSVRRSKRISANSFLQRH